MSRTQCVYDGDDVLRRALAEAGIFGSEKPTGLAHPDDERVLTDCLLPGAKPIRRNGGAAINPAVESGADAAAFGAAEFYPVGAE